MLEQLRCTCDLEKNIGSMKSTVHLPNLPASTERLRLEQLAMAHVDVLHQALCDARVYDYIQGSWPENKDVLRAQFTRMLEGPKPESHQTWWNFAVLLASDHVGIGRLEATIVGLHAEIAYLLGSEYWQQGYGTESVQWLLDALAHAGIKTAYATIYPANAASETLLRKLGFDEIFSGYPELYSLDEGDRVFRKKLLR
jgi:RimJ/RimL family protein N-acetyltransferase